MFDVVADIAFIVDQSSSIRSKNFNIVRNFLKNTIGGLDMGEGKIKIAVVLYSDFPRADVYFNTFDDKTDILRYISSMPYGRGKTYTGAALKFAKEHVFTKGRGSRRDHHVQQVAVVITDGKSTDKVAGAAAALRRSGVTVFALGIKDTEEDDLREIASYPYKKFVFSVKDFDKLNSLSHILTKTICNEIIDSIIPIDSHSFEKMIPLFEEAVQTRGEKVRKLLIVITDGESRGTEEPVEVPAKLLRTEQDVAIYAIGVKNASVPELELISGSPQRKYFVKNYDFLNEIKKNIYKEICVGCEDLFADIVFLLDGSESTHTEDFENMKDIMKHVIERFAIGPDKERVAVVQYGTDTKEEFSLNTFDDKAVLLQEIRNIKQMNGKTNTGKALTAVSQSFAITKGGRTSALKFLIVLTDGESWDDVAEPAKVLRDNFININAIGMKHANKSQILAIAGSHDGVFFEDAVALLRQIASEPYDQHVYSVSDFAALQGISQSVIQKVCTTVEETQKEVILMSRGKILHCKAINYVHEIF
uniref:Si:ch211-62a1.3 n=1 Tax=Cyprinus carpio TaxID=7962 RepID=A0A8C2PZ66_CYPCA